MTWQQQKAELENPRPSDRKVHQGYQKEQLGQYWCGTLPVTTPYCTTAWGSAECQWLHFPARPPTRYGFWCSTLISLSEGDIPRWNQFSFSNSASADVILHRQSWWPSDIEWPETASAILAMFRSSGACQGLELICSLPGKHVLIWEVTLSIQWVIYGCSMIRFMSGQPGWPHYTKGQINKHAVWVPYVLVTH